MLKFAAEDMWVEYHHVVRITPQGVIHVKDPETGARRRFKITQKLYTDYRRFARVTFFPEHDPHRMALMLYQGKVVDIEPAPLFKDMDADMLLAEYSIDAREHAKKWVSNMEKNYRKLVDEEHFINHLYDFWFDGGYLYSTRKNLDGFNQVSLDERFYLGRAKAYKLYTLKMRDFFMEYGREGKERPRFIYRAVMAYKAPKGVVVSPTVTTNSLFKEDSFILLDPPKDMLDRFSSQYHVNLDFVLQAAKTVRSMYHYKALGFLRLHEVMATLKVSTLSGVDKSIRRLTPVAIDLRSAMAWLFGFISKETDYGKVAKLFKLFNMLMTKGLVFDEKLRQEFEQRRSEFLGREHVETSTTAPPLLNVDEYRNTIIASVDWAGLYGKTQDMDLQDEAVDQEDFELNMSERIA